MSASVRYTSRFPISEQWLSRSESCEAWSATLNAMVGNDRFIPGAYPTFASHARGAHVWDVDGNRYIDFILGYGTVVLGHAHEAVTAAAVREIGTGVNISPLWRPAQVELAELFKEVIPDTEMSFFMRAGSDATSGALRLARIFTGRDRVVRWGYHGWHDWCCPRAEGIPRDVRAHTLTFEYNNLDSLRAVFDEHPDEIACVIMMPVEVDIAGPGFLEGVRQIAHEHGALFILDEMRSGFRMALGGAQAYFGVRADLATYGKAMSNGFCISAITGRADVMRGLSRTHMASTFYANSAEMAAALATIAILRGTDALSRIWSVGEMFQEGLRHLIARYDVNARVVGYAPMPFLVFTAADEAERHTDMGIFYSRVTELGTLLHPNHHWFVSAAHTADDITAALEACEEGFAAVQEHLRA